jgi:uncharacterized protein
MPDLAARIGACLAGAILVLLAAPVAADDVVPSFDCKKAATRIEKKICNDEFLSFRDGALGALVNGLRRSEKELPGLGKLLRAWLRTRNATCGRVRENKLANCLLARYDVVLAQLTRRMAKAGIGPAGRGLQTFTGDYGRKMKGFSGTVTVVEMPDMTAWVEISTVNGPTYHLCNLWTASARRVGATISWRDKDEPKCAMTLQFKARTVRPKGTLECRRYYCGARGAFMDIEYRR